MLNMVIKSYVWETMYTINTYLSDIILLIFEDLTISLLHQLLMGGVQFQHVSAGSPWPPTWQ